MNSKTSKTDITIGSKVRIADRHDATCYVEGVIKGILKRGEAYRGFIAIDQERYAVQVTKVALSGRETTFAPDTYVYPPTGDSAVELMLDAVTQAARLKTLQTECAVLLSFSNEANAVYEAQRAEYRVVEEAAAKVKVRLNTAKQKVVDAGYALKNSVDAQEELMLSLAKQLLAPAIVGTEMKDASLGKYDGVAYMEQTVRITEVTFKPVHLAKLGQYNYKTGKTDDRLVPKPFDKYRSNDLNGLLGVVVTGFLAVELKRNGEPGKKVHDYKVDGTDPSDELFTVRSIARGLTNKSRTAWQWNNEGKVTVMFPAYYEFDGTKACFAEVYRNPSKND